MGDRGSGIGGQGSWVGGRWGQGPNSSGNADSKYLKALDDENPARKQVAFVGWPDNVEAHARLNQLETYLKQTFPTHRPLKYLNEYKGPYSNRKLGKAAYVEFATKDEVREFTEAFKNAGAEVHSGGTKLKVAPATTKLNKQRNWALFKAEELVKGAAPPGAKVEVVRKPERKVTVDGTTAFNQPKDVTRGSFAGAFAHLALPP